MTQFIATLCCIFFLFLVGLYTVLKLLSGDRKHQSVAGLIYVILFLSLAYFSDLSSWQQMLLTKKNLALAKRVFSNPKRLKELMKNLEVRTKQFPNDDKAWFLLGRIDAGQGEWEKAHDKFLKAHQLDPKNDKYALFYVESVWRVLGHLNAFSWHILDDILKRSPNTPDVYLLKAEDALMRHCPREALGYWQSIRPFVEDVPEIAKNLDVAIRKASKESNSHCESRAL